VAWRRDPTPGHISRAACTNSSRNPAGSAVAALSSPSNAGVGEPAYRPGDMIAEHGTDPVQDGHTNLDYLPPTA
jgi:hypothetical protein